MPYGQAHKSWHMLVVSHVRTHITGTACNV
jgi:hypothetical protein